MSAPQISRYLRLILSAVSFGAILSISLGYAADPEKFSPVPKASCGPQDRTESVQGQTTLAERFRPGPAKAYNCNLELVGQFEGEGTSFDMEVFQNCAYYSTARNSKMRHPGVPVLDVSDSRHPNATTYLDSPAMLDAAESLKVATTSKLLLAGKWPTVPDAALEIYDLSADCRHPVLMSSSLPGLFLHAGEFAHDGRTFYGAKGNPDTQAPPASGIFALDTGDPSNPRLIATWLPPKDEWRTHAVSVSKDGTRAYVALLRWKDDQEKSPDVNGLVILDVKDVQVRRDRPQFRLVSTQFWDDSHFAQFPLPVEIRGQPYLIFTDLAGAIGISTPRAADVCDSGKPGHGFARIIDIGDERHPRTVSKLMLEVHDPANCSKVIHDPTAVFGYGSLECDVDNNDDAKLLVCGYFEGGLRVFDIRNPARPREVAYYKPPARRAESRPGSLIRPQAGKAKDYTADQVVVPRFRRNGDEIWFISADNGFQVVRFTDRFRASHPDLFRN